VRNDRPTVTPPFDPAEYARASESKQRVTVRAAEEESGVLPAGRSIAQLDELDARTPACATPVLLASIPYLSISPRDLTRAGLDHRAGFIVSLIDGTSDVAMILDMSAMPQDEALAILAELVSRGVIVLR
jgi:hypothetical protein